MAVSHEYEVSVEWTGNRGEGTRDYKSYDRNFLIHGTGKPDIAGSSDAAFRGDPARWNPEDLLLASVSACHKLWYLHLCADAGIQVTSYQDHAIGRMITDAKGGAFKKIILRPVITIVNKEDIGKSQALHHDAHQKCFLANSVNFPIEIDARISAETADSH